MKNCIARWLRIDFSPDFPEDILIKFINNNFKKKKKKKGGRWKGEEGREGDFGQLPLIVASHFYNLSGSDPILYWNSIWII